MDQYLVDMADQWQASAPKRAERQRAWRKAHPEKVREWSRDWQRRNPEKKRESVRRANAKNPAAKAARQLKRRGLLRGPGMSSAEWRQLVASYSGLCAYCSGGGPLEIEHIVPVSRGGEHGPDNIVPACRSCNSRKHARPLLVFLAERRAA